MIFIFIFILNIHSKLETSIELLLDYLKIY